MNVTKETFKKSDFPEKYTAKTQDSHDQRETYVLTTPPPLNHYYI